MLREISCVWNSAKCLHRSPARKHSVDLISRSVTYRYFTLHTYPACCAYPGTSPPALPSGMSGALQAAARSSGGQGDCSDLEQTGHDRPSPSAAQVDAVLQQKPRPMRHDFYSTVPTDIPTVYCTK